MNVRRGKGEISSPLAHVRRLCPAWRLRSADKQVPAVSKGNRPSPQDVSRGALALQLHRLDLGHEPATIVGEKGGDNAERGVTEAADIQDVGPIRGLGRGVRLEVDAIPRQAEKAAAPLLRGSAMISKPPTSCSTIGSRPATCPCRSWELAPAASTSLV
jgi:hypothetical protein